MEEEESGGCIVTTNSFHDATNQFAIRNLLLHINRDKKVYTMDPPLNKQMRFGFYKASHLFIGITFQRK